jgi:alpha-D-xyloside xylohydrolase
MAASLRGGLSLSLCGFGFWSHDIGGFEGTPPAEVYKRWVAFGLLSTHSRLHGSSSYRVPWVYDDEAVSVLREFTKLKCRLMPYLFGQAAVAALTGVPVMRALMLEFSGDPACDTLDRQYMLGDSLLVAPVFTPKGAVQYYLPPGNWTNLITGQVVAGPGWQREKHGFLSLPVMVRPNTLLAIGARDDVPDYNYAEGVTFRLYVLEDGCEAVAAVPDLKGATVLTARVSRSANVYEVQVTGPGSWRLELVGIESVSSVTGGSALTGESGVMVTPNTGIADIRIEV